MTSKHTPGPWFVSKLRAGVAIVDSDETTVAAAHKRPSGFMSEPVEQEANARLIAAAPDLLEALRSAYKFIADQYRSEESIAMDGEFVSREARPVWNLICNALAKAEGGK